jgi:hypothetical protein
MERLTAVFMSDVLKWEEGNEFPGFNNQKFLTRASGSEVVEHRGENKVSQAECFHCSNYSYHNISRRPKMLLIDLSEINYFQHNQKSFSIMRNLCL